MPNELLDRPSSPRHPKIGFWAPASIALVLVLTLAGTLYVRKIILERHMLAAMAIDDNATVAKLANAFPSPVNARDENGRTPLHWAVHWDNRALVETLLRKGALVNAKDNRNVTPLCLAVMANDCEVVRALLTAGADVDAKDQVGNTPLHEAAARNYLDVARWLLEFGADIGGRNGNGETPFDMAVRATRREVAELFLSRGARVTGDKAVQARMLMSALDTAYAKNRTEEQHAETPPVWIRLLVRAGADVNARTADNETALVAAAHRLDRPFPTLKALLDLGADVNARDKNGRTALHGVVRSFVNRPDVASVKLLIDRGIDVNAADADFDTAFEWVASALGREGGEAPYTDTERARLAAAKLILTAGGGKAANYSDAPVTVVPEAPKTLDPVVADLLLPEKRNDAWRTILSWQKYRSKPSAPDRFWKPLRHVVACPQKAGPPIYAVFPWVNYEHRSAPKGWIILVDADGAMIPYYMGANSLDDPSEFRDINGDGVVEEVLTFNIENTVVLHVLPETREQRPILNIALRPKDSPHFESEWSWRLVETDQTGIFAVEIGPKDPATGQLTPKARFDWSAEKQQYVGPKGGGDLPFLRLDDAPDPFQSAEFKAFAGKEE